LRPVGLLAFAASSIHCGSLRGSDRRHVRRRSL